MSHFTRLTTQMVEKEYLLKALQDAGFTYQEGEHLEVHGFSNQHTPVEIRVQTQHAGYDIGFRKADNVYECIADWWGIRSINQQQFLGQVMQRYAYHASCAKLEAQGFALVQEEVEEGQQIRLRFRRMV